MTQIVLKTKLSRMGNRKKIVLFFDSSSELVKVVESEITHGAKYAIETSPTEVKSFIDLAKRRGIFSYG